MTDDPTDDRERADSAGERPRVEVPDEVELPRLLDFYGLQEPEHTQIAEFYENLRDGDLTTTECASCGERHFPPRIVCPECLSDDLTYVTLPREGTLYSFTEVRAGAPVGLEDELPFVTAIVQLDEIRLSARIDGATADDLAIGDPVRLVVVDVDGPADHERVYYQFEPV